MNPVVSLVFDAFIFVALVTTLYYCINLSRQFNAIQQSKKAFDDLIKSMNFASARAEGVIYDLKQAMNEEGALLQEQVNKAKGIAAELEIIIQAGDSLATRLEQGASNRNKKDFIERSFVEDDEQGEEESIAAFSDDNGFKTRAEIELLEAVRRRQG